MLKKILILYPHFPPSNLAGVHRPRLFAQHLPSFGWEPIILTVDEKYYEEEPDYNLVKLLPKDLRIEKVKAFKITKPRLIGDIGLRAFFQLYKKAKQLILEEKIDFLYIPVPSFYCALLGGWLNRTTAIKYGIDYIDPWVHQFPGSDKVFSRHWFSMQVAKFLEPIAVKKASLITGVAEDYYRPVLERNPHLKKQAVYGAMPYGGEPKDHELLKQLDLKAYLFEKKPGFIQMVYAGAMLPKAYLPLEAVFKSIENNREVFANVEFHFIGTGKRTNDLNGFTIKPLAEKYNLWQTNVYEYPKRIPYLDVLVHLQAADGIFILGSTEPHYTPSKIYQAILSGKHLLAVLHCKSSGYEAIVKTKTGVALAFNGEDDLETICRSFADYFKGWLFQKNLETPKTLREAFSEYSAEIVSARLGLMLDKLL